MNQLRQQTSFLYITKKAERILAALYLITNHLDGGEPMKASLRSSGLSLFRLVLSFINVPRSERYSGLQRVETMTAEIISLMEVGRLGGIFSEANFSVLKREYESFVSLFREESFIQDESTKLLFPEDFFDSSIPEDVYRIAGTSLRESGQKTIEPMRLERREVIQAEGGDSIKDKKIDKILKDKNDRIMSFRKDMSDKNVEYKTPVRNGLIPTPSYTEPNIKKKSETRRKTMLAILAQKSPATVKDIAKVVTGCGEKTIQRELLSMVQKGILSKQGKRRWTTYTLA